MREIIGYIENITLISGDKKVRIPAKIDTGAYRSSVDITLASELGLTMVDFKKVRNVASSQIRPLVNLEFEMAGKRIKTRASVVDRKDMEYPVIIGRLDLGGFLVDPAKKSK